MTHQRVCFMADTLKPRTDIIKSVRGFSVFRLISGFI